MADIIAVTDDMTVLEKEKARAHNRKLMYKQMEEEDKKREKIEMSPEEETHAKELIRKLLREALPELEL